MTLWRRLIPFAGFAAIALGTGLGILERELHAQTATLGAPTATVPVQQIQPGDLVPLARGGVGQVPTQFANAGLIGGVLNNQAVLPTTGFTITPANSTTLLFLNPAATLATGTLTMPAAPGDAQTFCLLDTQAQTAITISANTGQTLVGTTPTALVANTTYCWRYVAATSSWYHTQGGTVP